MHVSPHLPEWEHDYDELKRATGIGPAQDSQKKGLQKPSCPHRKSPVVVWPHASFGGPGFPHGLIALSTSYLWGHASRRGLTRADFMLDLLSAFYGSLVTPSQGLDQVNCSDELEGFEVDCIGLRLYFV